MMLIKDFYTIEGIEVVDQKIRATILLNPDHRVYLGHFPGQPVVPGVIQLHIVKELLEQQLEHKLLVSNISQVKFLNMIIPDNQPLQMNITFQMIDEDLIKVDASISKEERVATKVKATYRLITSKTPIFVVSTP